MSIISSSVIKNRNRQIAIIGAFSALIILMGIPGLHLGYIQLNPATSLTIMHIPVILSAILAGLPGALVTGTVFGLTSLVNAAANPSGVLDPLFVNPLISVLPRILFGTFCWILFKLIDFIPHLPKSINSAVTAFLGTLCHTTLVIGSLFVFASSKTAEAMEGAGFIAVMTVILPGAIMEAVAAIIVCSAVISAIFVTSVSKSKFSRLEKDNLRSTENNNSEANDKKEASPDKENQETV